MKKIEEEPRKPIPIEEVDISTDMGGCYCSSPITVGSHDPDKPWYPATSLARWVGLFKKYEEAGAGHLITPSIVPEPYEEPKEFFAHKGRRHFIGRWLPYHYRDWRGNRNLSAGYFWTGPTSIFVKKKEGGELVKGMVETIDQEKCPIMANVLVDINSTNTDIWVEHSKWYEDLGVKTLELNFGCPCGAFELPPGIPAEDVKFGMLLGVMPNMIQQITSAVVKNTKIPVYVKITPETGYPGIVMAAEAAMKGGAVGVVTTHMGFSVPPPDIYGDPPGKTPWPFMKSFPPATIAGPAERFFMYKGVAYVHANFPNLEIEAGAGIVHPEHVIEAIFLGAKTAQSFSGIVWNGINFLKRTNEFLRTYMAERGFRTIEDFRGFTIKKYFKALELDDFIPSYAAVDQGRCIKCGVCFNNWCPAISEDKQSATINPEECSGCAMCSMICPVGAIHLFEWGKPAKFSAGQPYAPFGM